MPKKSALAEPLLDGGDSDTTPPPRCVVWQLIFFVNVFFACISFSIVMPSLYLYLSSMNASTSFYALVVAIYSVGEAIGSLGLGALSNMIGIKPTLQLCTLIALSGSTSYALAEVAHTLVDSSVGLGPTVVLAGRLLQGIGSGGQQAVEQSYLAIAAPTAERTSLTSQLNTFACLGFIFGPALGAAVTQTPDVRIGLVDFNSFTKAGWVVAALNLCMLLSTTFGFTELKRGDTIVLEPEAAEGVSTPSKRSPPADGRPHSPSHAERERGRSRGVWACVLFFFIHFNGFAVQETITTPLVKVHARELPLDSASPTLPCPLHAHHYNAHLLPFIALLTSRPPHLSPSTGVV